MITYNNEIQVTFKKHKTHYMYLQLVLDPVQMQI